VNRPRLVDGARLQYDDVREEQEGAVAALKFKPEVRWAQLEAIERGDTQPEAPA